MKGPFSLSRSISPSSVVSVWLPCLPINSVVHLCLSAHSECIINVTVANTVNSLALPALTSRPPHLPPPSPPQINLLGRVGACGRASNTRLYQCNLNAFEPPISAAPTSHYRLRCFCDRRTQPFLMSYFRHCLLFAWPCTVPSFTQLVGWFSNSDLLVR